MLRLMMTSGALLLLLLVPSIAADEGSGDFPTPDSWSASFKCGSKYCPAGQDCLYVNGSRKCFDPCKHYTALEDPRRSVSYKRVPGDTVNDRSRDWEGWYRLSLNGLNAKMPEKCVDESMCGTRYPIWLSTPHPTSAEGLVRSRVCTHKWSCCRDVEYIHVKACPGDFYIYKLVDVEYTESAYCAVISEAPKTTPEPTTTTGKPTTTTTTRKPTTTRPPKPTTTTTPKPTTTTAPEPTTKTPKLTTTTPPEPTKKTTHAISGGLTTSPKPLTREPRPPIPDTELVCGRNLIQVGLNRAHLKAGGLNASSAHLADRRCSAFKEQNGTVWYPVERREGDCGNTLKTNGSHAIFSNNLFVYPLTVPTGSLPRPVRIPFSCVYPMDTQTSLDVPINPLLGGEGTGIINIGSQAKASMSLYHNANYTGPYPAGKVSLPVGTALHVGVSVEETETERFVVILDDCYVTHSPNPDDLIRYYLLQHRCSSDRRQVTVEESGLSLQARFSALLYLYRGDYQDVFLHCSLSLCDKSSSSCSAACNRRKSRSVSKSVPLKPLTIGPITWTLA